MGFGWQIKKFSVLTAISLLFSACSNSPPAAKIPAANAPEYKVGMVLIGPKEDAGWNQAHYEGMQYVLKKTPNLKFDYIDKVNPSDRPTIKGYQVADNLIAKGAKLIIFNSEDYKDDALETAKKHPNIIVIHASGDYAWKEGKNFKNQPNLGNIMGKIEYGKMISGCAAALETESGKIGYLGSLINEETRRLSSSTYLGAKYCWEKYRHQKPENLKFKVTWIGFWFNIPGVTLDPTKVADDFYNSGYDVLISGIDTPEAIIQGKKAAEAGKRVKVVHYDLKTGCNLAPDICLGVPYYNWGPLYLAAIQKAMEDKYTSEFVWAAPDWKDINNPDTSPIGFEPGQALGEQKKFLDQFIQGLADGSINLYKGPIKFQDGTDYLKDGEVATPVQIWYLPQLLAGIEGASK